MNCSWMNANRLSEEYEKGVEEFLQFALKKLPESKGRFYCPCVICLNENTLHFEEIRSYLICFWIDLNYIRWIWHGDSLNMSNTSEREEVNVDMNDQLEDMICDVGQESFNRAHVYDNLCSDKEEPLYPGRTNFTRLSAVLILFNLKARNGWTDKSFTELLELLKEMLPEDILMPIKILLR
uniref:Uncharacterized protein LOC113783976 n=1 Tax=Cicer arietinum TaxID=3827 RepID=A0A3Q7YAU2_CICAR|nr:uncharacterized protein LOC113783976 [Cicer arietinum]